ncbi:aspartyl-tRNA(Asn)/glutamyl-tRNA(Gln) amidotransferase subunit A [Yoonia sediminilitoris]|uniref:Aspartyl-tRNA(Asn)/glutamyl-tRNA(Gln) amidotransferase subunit A n=2 Tax=Yoonia sediminilitoris TaxID=1286148 RepID=A0A2T6KMK2_9RHOB|nr:aspartyl-tRNA(Asn)/glutamyl-tRNA(Gln) amidotransferase subunit A [Yoonia sediminilitoris]RCW97744.1 aspartyl-tRNA(Asn)/glutamyl-tRNA(Gln) amidotransferase subunit A [Yoonia sediminilitoris]
MWQADVTALLAAFADGSTTPLQAMETTLHRIDTINPALNAFTARNDHALSEAAAATTRWQAGTPAGLLDGIPLIIKDNLVTKGMPAAWGNAYLASQIAQHDEAPVARLRDAGAIFLGKGNTPEFAIEGYTDNLTFGVTRNPFDPALTPGGSSGGVVAAVAAGLAFAGIGTDGGGSIRRPAGYTGLFGLKPGIGRVRRSGGLPQVLLDFEVVGPIARSARDLALIDRVLSGNADPPATWDRLKILAIETLADAPCDPTIRAAFAATCDRLSELGHHVAQKPMPLELDQLNALWTDIGAIGLAAYLNDHPNVRESANPKYLKIAETGAGKSAADLYRVLDLVFKLRNDSASLFQQYDAILMPTAAANPWPAAEPFPASIAGQSVGPRGHAIYTGWINAAGLPAVAFPAPSDGLPIGMQLVGPMGSEPALIAWSESCAKGFTWPKIAGGITDG